MLNAATLALLLGLAAAAVWGSLKGGWRNAAVKWSIRGAAVVAAIACITIAALMLNGMARLTQRTAPIPDLHVVVTPQRIARGEEIARTFCDACHTGPGLPDGTLSGGVDVGRHLPLPLGTMVSGNLTPAGAVAQWTDGQLFRAIRNAVDADGHWLVIMSYTNAGHLSDDDLQSVIAYIRSRPAAGAPTPNPPDSLNPLGLAMLGAGLLPTGHPILTDPIAAPAKAPTEQYGEYILSFQDCRACHGADLKGGVKGQMPPIGPDLELLQAWSLQDFVKTMRTGIDPDGHQIQDPMPWQQVGKMDDTELAALYQALRRVGE